MINLGNGNSIGSLLRFIQEQKSQSPAMVSPKADTGSPIRGVVQEPLKGPEDVGTSKVVSLRPEGVIGDAAGITKDAIAPKASTLGWVGVGGTDVATPGMPASVPGMTQKDMTPGQSMAQAAKPQAQPQPSFSAPTEKTPSASMPIKQSNQSINKAGVNITPALNLQNQITEISNRPDVLGIYKEQQGMYQSNVNKAKAELDVFQQQNPDVMKDKETFDKYLALLNNLNTAWGSYDTAAESNYGAVDIANKPSASPTPSPTPSNRSGSNSGSSGGGSQPSQSRPSTTISKSTPGISYSSPKPVTIGTPTPVNISSAVKSGGLTVNKPAPAPSKPAPSKPSIGTILTGAIGQAFKKLFGR